MDSKTQEENIGAVFSSFSNSSPRGSALSSEFPHVRESLVHYREAESFNPQLHKKSTEGKKSGSLVDVLNAILPPRQFTSDEGAKMVQAVSAIPSSRDQVITLQMKLDEKLQERQARENGICPVREELYAQCFDELIREVTIESPERGLLLMRVRDEVRMTINAYQTLYQSSITFGMRKTLQAEQGNTELMKRIEELEHDKKKAQATLQDHKGLYEAIEKRIAEQKAQEEKKMQEEKDFLKFQAQHLESFLKSAIQ